MLSGVYAAMKQWTTKKDVTREFAEAEKVFIQTAQDVRAISKTRGYAAIMEYLRRTENTAINRLVTTDDVRARAVAEVSRGLQDFLGAMISAKDIEKTASAE